MITWETLPTFQPGPGVGGSFPQYEVMVPNILKMRAFAIDNLCIKCGGGPLSYKHHQQIAYTQHTTTSTTTINQINNNECNCFQEHMHRICSKCGAESFEMPLDMVSKMIKDKCLEEGSNK